MTELGITAEQLNIVKNYAEINSNIGFEYCGIWITNIFLDPTARFDLSVKAAITTYGIENCRNYCREILEVVL